LPLAKRALLLSRSWSCSYDSHGDAPLREHDVQVRSRVGAAHDCPATLACPASGREELTARVAERRLRLFPLNAVRGDVLRIGVIPVEILRWPFIFRSVYTMVATSNTAGADPAP